MINKEEHVGNMETRLRLWGARYDELVCKAEEIGTEAKIDYRKSIEELKWKHQIVEKRLVELKVARNEEWEALKTGVENAWNEFEVAFKKMTA